MWSRCGSSLLQVLRSATHKLLKKSSWASFSTNGKHLRQEIPKLCVQACLSGFGLPFSELYELHVVVALANLGSSNFMSDVLAATETKMLGKYPPHCLH